MIDPSHPSSIDVRNLVVAFDDGTPTLNQLNLTVSAGEIVALLGASGCGKSTLLRVLANLQPVQAGEIAFGGEVPSRRRSDLAFVFQDPNLLPWRSVEENVRLPLELAARGQRSGNTQSSRPLVPVTTSPTSGTSQDRTDTRNIDSRQIEGREINVHEILRMVGLEAEVWSRFPHQLSGGMRMRTSLARALVTDPSILLMDEPFAALDDMLRTKMNELILQLWQARRRTIVFVTHNIAEAIYLSHRVAILGQGRIVAELNNPLPWPRQAEQRSNLEFAEFYGQVSKRLAETA